MDYMTIAEKAKDANMDEARELHLYALNTSEPYHALVEPTNAALARHAKRGRYDMERAVVAWKRVADEMAKRYAREYAGRDEWNTVFSVADRCAVAISLEESERENVFWKANNKEV